MQIHVAHFFFLSRFVSPLINRREDGYGGTPEKRARIVKEIVAEVRRKVGPEYPILAETSAPESSSAMVLNTFDPLENDTQIIGLLIGRPLVLI